MKNYSVSIVAFATVVVLDAENEEDALDRAMDELDMGDMNLDEGKIEKQIPDEELESYQRHADAVAKKY